LEDEVNEECPHQSRSANLRESWCIGHWDEPDIEDVECDCKGVHERNESFDKLVPLLVKENQIHNCHNKRRHEFKNQGQWR
jgi:hypothetical protein